MDPGFRFFLSFSFLSRLTISSWGSVVIFIIIIVALVGWWVGERWCLKTLASSSLLEYNRSKSSFIVGGVHYFRESLGGAEGVIQLVFCIFVIISFCIGYRYHLW